MKHVEYRIFTIFNYEDEEKWLNEKSKNGEQLTDAGLFRYVFEDGKPNEYIYRLEMLEYLPNHYKSSEYIRLLEETGVEHISSIFKWVYLRKKKSEGEFDLYSDLDSKIKYCRRIINFANMLILLQLMVSMPFVFSFMFEHEVNNLSYVNLILAALIFIGNRKLYKKVDKLEKEKLYRE